MHKTKTMICLSTALAMALGGAGLPAAAMAQEAVGSAGIATVTSMAVSMIDEADFDKDAKVEIAVQRALAQIPAGASDFEKARILHDYLMDNCEYDDDAVGHYDERPEAYSAYGALVNKLAVCDGYAKAYRMLCERAGLECLRVLNRDHAWNLVKVDSEWFHVDCTFDDKSSDDPLEMQRRSYEFFLLSDEAIKVYGHHHTFFCQEVEQLPEASSRFDSCGWKRELGSSFYHGTAFKDGAAYYCRGDIEGVTELVRWTPEGEAVLAQGSMAEDSEMWDMAEFNGEIYYTMGRSVYKLNNQDESVPVKENLKQLVGLEIDGNQLLVFPVSYPSRTQVLLTVPTSDIPCSHSYSAQMQPVTATEDGRFVDTCSACGDVRTYVIPATGDGGASSSGPSASVTPPTPPVIEEGNGGGNGGGSGSAGEQATEEEGAGGENAGEQEAVGEEATGNEGSDEEQASEGEGSQEQQQQQEQLVKPAKAKGVKAVAKKGAATVSWAKVKGASGYQVACKAGSGAWKRVSAPAKASSKTIAKLKSGQVCQLKVRALAKSGGKTVAGAWSKVVRIRVK